MRVVVILEEDHRTAVVEAPVEAGITKIIFKPTIEQQPAATGSVACAIFGLYLAPDRARLCRLLRSDKPIDVCNGVAGIEGLMKRNDALPHLSCRIELLVAEQKFEK